MASTQKQQYDRAMISPTQFDKIADEILKFEGGFVDNPADPGGPTKFGVSLRFMLDLHAQDIDTYVTVFGMRNSPLLSTVQALTKKQAKAALNYRFWSIRPYAELPFDVAMHCVDLAYNAGHDRSARVLQLAINATQTSSAPPLVSVDGVLGPQTVAAVYALVEGGNEDLLITGIVHCRKEFYFGLSRRRPALKVFLKGWFNRVDAIKDTPDLPPHLEGKTTDGKDA
jgi:lysozyme family protein